MPSSDNDATYSHPPPPYSELPPDYSAFPPSSSPDLSPLRRQHYGNSLWSTTGSFTSPSSWIQSQISANFRGARISTTGPVDICSNNIVTNGSSLNVTYADPGDAPAAPLFSIGNDPFQRSFGTRSASRPSSPPLRTMPCDHLYIRNSNRRIEGSYEIDLERHTPPSQLPRHVGECHNFEANTSNGMLNLKLMVKQKEEKNKERLCPDDKPVSIQLKTSNGRVCADIMTETSLPIPRRRPFRINVSTTNGSIQLRLPPSFQGLITMGSPTLAGLKFDGDVRSQVTALNGSNTEFFMGDMSPYEKALFDSSLGRSHSDRLMASGLSVDVARLCTSNGGVNVGWVG